jgi:hypothetical protein
MPCRLAPHRVSGSLYLTTDHMAFSTLSVATGPSAAAVTICHALSRISCMARAFVGRSRAISFTLSDKSHFMVFKFEGEQRDKFYEMVRQHVAGSDTALDRQLRAVAPAVAAAALKLPPGERILRSYACALTRLPLNRRGVLYVLSKQLVFVPSKERKERVVAFFKNVTSVDVYTGRWTGQPSVHVSCKDPPRRFEVGPLSLAKAAFGAV